MPPLNETTAIGTVIGATDAIGQIAEGAVRAMQISGQFSEFDKLSNDRQEALLREAATYMQDAVNQGILAGMEEEARYMEALAEAVPTFDTSERERVADVLTHYATSQGALGFDFTRNAMLFFQAQLAASGEDSAVNKDRNIAAQLAIVAERQEEAARAARIAEITGGALDGVFDHPDFANWDEEPLAILRSEVEKINDATDMDEELSNIIGRSDRGMAHARTVEENYERYVAYILSDESPLTHEQKARIVAMHERAGGDYGLQSHELRLLVDEIHRTGEVPTDVEARIDAAIAMMEGRTDQLAATLIAEISSQHGEEAGERLRNTIYADGHADLSTLPDMSDPAVQDAIRNFNHNPNHPAADLAIQAIMRTTYASRAHLLDGAANSLYVQITEHPELLAGWENAHSMRDRMELLERYELLDHDSEVDGMVAATLVTFSADEIRNLSESSPERLAETFADRAVTRAHDIAFTQAVTLHGLRERQNISEQTRIATDAALARYPEGTLMGDLFRRTARDLAQVSGPEKLELFQRFASGEFGAADSQEAVVNASIARYQTTGAQDAIVTNVRIAESRRLAEFYPGNPDAGIPNGHREYYAAFRENTERLGFDYPTYTPPTEGETEEARASRMEINLADARRALANPANHNADGTLNTSSIFLTNEVRTALLRTGELNVEQAELIRQNGKTVYDSMVVRYLAHDTEQGNALLLQADENVSTGVPMERWEPDVRLAFMLREMHSRSSSALITMQMAHTIANTNLSGDELRQVVSTAVAQPNATAAVRSLVEHTGILPEGEDVPRELEIYLAMGLTGMRELGEGASIGLSTLARTIVDAGDNWHQSEEVQAQIAALSASVLPDDITLEEINNSVYIKSELSRLFSEALDDPNGQLPTREAIAQVVNDARGRDEKFELVNALRHAGISASAATTAVTQIAQAGGESMVDCVTDNTEEGVGVEGVLDVIAECASVEDIEFDGEAMSKVFGIDSPPQPAGTQGPEEDAGPRLS